MNKKFKNTLQVLTQLLVLNLFILVGYGGGLDNTSLIIFFIILNGGYLLLKWRGKNDDDSFSGMFRI
jgi:hypothetical protein